MREEGKKNLLTGIGIALVLGVFLIGCALIVDSCQATTKITCPNGVTTEITVTGTYEYETDSDEEDCISDTSSKVS